MKKYTNKILIAVGILLLVCNIVVVSCSLNRYSEYDDDSYDDYDEYYYYDDEDDDLMDEQRY
jgi:hypothetical protein